MTALFRWAVRRPLLAVLLWLGALAAIGAGAFFGGGSYDDSFELPDTESASAQDLLEREFGGVTSQASVDVVFSGADGTAALDPSVVPPVQELLDEAASLEDVAQVVAPFDVPPEQAAQQGLVGPEGQVAVARVVFDGAVDEIEVSSVRELVDLAEQTREAPGLELGLAGQPLDLLMGAPPVVSEAVGVGVAIVVLLIAFGSVVAAGLPILTALLGLAAGLASVTLLANVFTVATFAPTLAVMIGLGVGIDYGLFVVNRFRRARLDGAEPRAAATEAVSTAGRAVLFAASAVVIALLGLFVLRIGFLNGLAIAASVTVVFVMLSATLLLPASLSLLGRRALAGKVWGADRRAANEGRLFQRWADVLQARPALVAGVATAALVGLSTPLLGLQIGFPDASGDEDGSITNTAYELTAEGFGAGANGPFLVAVDLASAGELAPAQALSEALNGTEGVAFASPPQPAESGEAALLQVQPTTGPQDAETSQTLERVRDTAEGALDGSGAEAFVGGVTAISADFTTVLTDALPLFLAVVVGLGFLALTVLFRSVLVPALGAVSSLLTLGVALGVATLVFQEGFADDLLGVSGTGPIFPFLPIMVFAILFGLAMDYQVFLVSRMQEEWQLTGDPRESVRAGLVGSGRVVVAAALILASVFLAFVFGDDRIIKTFGLTLGIGVLVDAFVVRLMIIPALMTLLGRSVWWLPGWLDRLLPTVDVEGERAARDEDGGDENRPGSSSVRADEPAGMA